MSYKQDLENAKLFMVDKLREEIQGRDSVIFPADHLYDCECYDCERVAHNFLKEYTALHFEKLGEKFQWF